MVAAAAGTEALTDGASAAAAVGTEHPAGTAEEVRPAQHAGFALPSGIIKCSYSKPGVAVCAETR